MKSRQLLAALLAACLLLVAAASAEISEPVDEVVAAESADLPDTDQMETVNLAARDTYSAITGIPFLIEFPTHGGAVEVTGFDGAILSRGVAIVGPSSARVVINPLQPGTTRLTAACGGDVTYPLMVTVSDPAAVPLKLYPLDGAPLARDLTSIGPEAFANTALTVLRLPAGVVDIADDALEGSAIRTIYAPRGSYAWKWAVKKGFVPEANAIPDLLDTSHSRTGGDGDVFCQPDDHDLQLSTDGGRYCLYYDNLLVVYLIDPPAVADVQAMLDAVGGTLVGCNALQNRLEIKVPSTDMDGLNALADVLRQFDGVAYVDYYPYLAEPSNEAGTANVLDDNPWNGEAAGRANALLPSGNDWWAEAIGAYTAWRYADRAGTIEVGVIDSGIDESNADLSGKVTRLTLDYNASHNSHGTGVAGIIAASNNTSLIRGIADRADIVYCHDDATTASDIRRLVQHGARIINMSLGYNHYSEQGYRDYIGDTYIQKWYDVASAAAYIWQNLSFDDQLKAANDQIDEDARFSQRSVLFELIGLLRQGQDFLLVESAGNGLDNAGKTGDSAVRETRILPINPELFNEIAADDRARLAAQNITFQSIRDRIIIVSGVVAPSARRNYMLHTGLNYGGDVDIVAPGWDIYTLSSGHDGDQTNSGTSFAAPMVTGSAALLRSIDSSLSMTQLKQILIQTGSKHKAFRLGGSEYYPLLDVGAAVESRLDHVIELSGYLAECMSESAKELGLNDRRMQAFDDVRYMFSNGTVWFYNYNTEDEYDGVTMEIFINGDSREGDPADRTRFSLFHLFPGMGRDELDFFIERYPYSTQRLADVIDCYTFVISGIYGIDAKFSIGYNGEKIEWVRFTWSDNPFVG